MVSTPGCPPSRVPPASLLASGRRPITAHTIIIAGLYYFCRQKNTKQIIRQWQRQQRVYIKLSSLLNCHKIHTDDTRQSCSSEIIYAHIDGCPNWENDDLIFSENCVTRP